MCMHICMCILVPIFILVIERVVLLIDSSPQPLQIDDDHPDDRQVPCIVAGKRR